MVVVLHPFLASAHHFFEATEVVSRCQWSRIITSSAEIKRRRGGGGEEPASFSRFWPETKGRGFGKLSMNNELSGQVRLSLRNSGHALVHDSTVGKLPVPTVQYEYHLCGISEIEWDVTVWGCMKGAQRPLPVILSSSSGLGHG